MKIQMRTNPVYEEIEREVPFYRKSKDVKCHYAKVINDEICLWVTVAKSSLYIGINAASLSLEEAYVDCSESEFNEAYLEANLRLQKLKDNE